jgi:hypothetical protein
MAGNNPEIEMKAFRNEMPPFLQYGNLTYNVFKRYMIGIRKECCPVTTHFLDSFLAYLRIFFTN